MSKIAKEIVAALQGFDASQILTDEGIVAKATELVDATIAGRTITRREVEQLRKDVESLKNTLEVVHVNLARAENEAATYKVTSDNWKQIAEVRDANGRMLFDLGGSLFQSVLNQNNIIEELRGKLWNTEKELNDLKKSLDVPPARAAELQWNGLPQSNAVQFVEDFVKLTGWKSEYPLFADAKAPTVTFSSIQAMTAKEFEDFIQDPANRKAVDVLYKPKSVPVISEPKSEGKSWLLAVLVLVILTGGAALFRYLSVTNLLGR